MASMRICSLCRKEKHLIRKSHIIPDFFFKESGVYNNNHQIHKIEVQKHIRSRKVSFIPTGDYEGQILCKECDNVLLGRLETYGSKVLYGGLSRNEYIECKNYKNLFDGCEFSVCENVDYKRFKLFLLSILWRASVTKRDLFNEAKMSSEDEECEFD